MNNKTNAEMFAEAMRNLTYGNAEEMIGKIKALAIDSAVAASLCMKEAKEFNRYAAMMIDSEMLADCNKNMINAFNSLCDGQDSALENSFDNYLLAAMMNAVAKACHEWFNVAHDNGFKI